jgi:hypothetical protein
MSLKELIASAITRAGSQTKLAIALSTSRQNVNHWLTGRCKPSMDMYIKLTEYIKDTFVPFKPGEE